MHGSSSAADVDDAVYVQPVGVYENLRPGALPPFPPKPSALQKQIQPASNVSTAAAGAGRTNNKDGVGPGSAGQKQPRRSPSSIYANLKSQFLNRRAQQSNNNGGNSSAGGKRSPSAATIKPSQVLAITGVPEPTERFGSADHVSLRYFFNHLFYVFLRMRPLLHYSCNLYLALWIGIGRSWNVLSPPPSFFEIWELNFNNLLTLC